MSQIIIKLKNSVDAGEIQSINNHLATQGLELHSWPLFWTQENLQLEAKKLSDRSHMEQELTAADLQREWPEQYEVRRFKIEAKKLAYKTDTQIAALRLVIKFFTSAKSLKKYVDIEHCENLSLNYFDRMADYARLAPPKAENA